MSEYLVLGDSIIQEKMTAMHLVARHFANNVQDAYCFKVYRDVVVFITVLFTYFCNICGPSLLIAYRFYVGIYKMFAFITG